MNAVEFGRRLLGEVEEITLQEVCRFGGTSMPTDKKSGEKN